MADEIFKAQKGLASVLDNIRGLKVYEVMPDTINQRSGVVALIHYIPGERLGLGGASFMGHMQIELIATPRKDNSAAVRVLLEHMAPVGNKSIEAAIKVDTTWNGTVDDGRLDALEPMTEIEAQDYPFHSGGPLMRVIMMAKFLKSVT